jgi:hypothetical protein
MTWLLTVIAKGLRDCQSAASVGVYKTPFIGLGTVFASPEVGCDSLGTEDLLARLKKSVGDVISLTIPPEALEKNALLTLRARKEPEITKLKTVITKISFFGGFSERK